MKRRVTCVVPDNLIPVNEVKNGHLIVAFSDVDGNVYILIGINNDEWCTWAFHPLYGDGFSEYVSSSMFDTIKQALEQYDVYTFETQTEFAKFVSEVSNDE